MERIEIVAADGSVIVVSTARVEGGSTLEVLIDRKAHGRVVRMLASYTRAEPEGS